ncbi:hypothetical protein AB0H03_36840 [Streptomyces sparsogenes]|uniref:hypothetical protein n=1 Tax=Streptomyces sparsogenes TaxID=67365 RepID=UPI0033D760ED
MSSYTVTVGETSVKARSIQEAQGVVMERITDLLALDPEAASQGALMANRAFSVGTVDHAIDAHGRWQTVITVQGEQVKVSIIKRRWWR